MMRNVGGTALDLWVLAAAAAAPGGCLRSGPVVEALVKEHGSERRAV